VERAISNKYTKLIFNLDKRYTKGFDLTRDKKNARCIFKGTLVGTEVTGHPGTSFDNSVRVKECYYNLVRKHDLLDYWHAFILGDDHISIVEEDKLQEFLTAIK